MCNAFFSHFTLTAPMLQAGKHGLSTSHVSTPDEQEPPPEPPEFPQTPSLPEIPQPNDPPDYPEIYSFCFTPTHYRGGLLALLSPTANGALSC